MNFSRNILRIVLAACLAVCSMAAGDPAPPPAPVPAATEVTSTNQGWCNQTYLLGDFNQERSKLEDEGCTIAPSYTAEVFGNPTGGAKQGAIYEGLLILPVTLDFQKMAGWDGTFHASLYYPMGNSLSAEDTHDILTVSNISAYNTPHLFELWYEQKFWDDKIALRVGQMAADQEFFISNNAAYFLCATYGWPAILSTSAPTPSYDYASPGVRLRIDPDEHWSFLSGVYAGNPAPDRLGDPDPTRQPGNQFDNSGTDFLVSGRQGLFSISELWYKLNQDKDARGLPGTYKIGGWFHTSTFADERYDNTGISLASPASSGIARSLDGNNGFYFIADQAVWQDKSDPNQTKEIDLFLRGGNALGDRSTFDYYGDAGVVFNGFVPGRPNDLFGLATARGNMAPGQRGLVEDQNTFNGSNLPIPDYEQNIEATYFAQITPWWSVQPDLQVIVHPGGSSALPTAVVLGCRTVINF